MTRPWRRHPVATASVAVVAVSAGLYVLLTLPTTTRQGVNYQITSYRIPLYLKAIGFLQRHFEYKRLVETICTGKTTDAERVLAIFDWTHENIPRTPDGWKIVDDHPLNIVIRGHGMDDQIADVFVTLSDYAGVPAFFKVLREPGPNRQLVLSFARIDGRWTVFDVRRHIAFRNRRGELATVDDLVSDTALVDEQANGVRVADVPYARFMSREQLLPFVVPRPLRATLQQPWPRLQHELRRGVGWEG
jgi:hypothetical protein